jgi:shikimate dehydrogenase
LFCFWFILKYDSNFKLIINTTPLGTFPAIESFPDLPYHFIGKDHLICDLVYNPSETKFMQLSKASGAAVLNGLSMLQFQADEAWKIWTNKKGHSV